MKLKETMKIFLFSILTFFSFSIKAQVIDSVIYKPFTNVDSIEYWHTIEQKENNQEYWTFGYYQNCNCDYHKFLNQKNYKSRDKFTIAEGLIVEGKKQGKWIYWRNAKGMCCDEMQIHTDSTVIYNSGKRIEKNDKYGNYLYQENDSLIVHPKVQKRFIELLIICKKNNCHIYTKDNLLIKSFSRMHLDEELMNAFNGEYDFKTRKTIEENNKR